MRHVLIGLVFISLEASALVAPLDFKVLVSAAAAEDKQQEIYAAATAYVQKNSTAEEQAKWSAKLKARVADAANSDETEEKFIRRVFQTFVEDNQKIFTEPEASEPKKVLECARLFCACIERGVSMPSRIADNMTPEVVERLLNFLKR